MTARSALVTLLVCAALTASCATSEPGTAVPSAPGDRSSSAPTTTSSEPQEPQAPMVTTPLDASAYIDDPCAILDERQLARFEVSRAGELETEGTLGKESPACGWRTDHEPLTWGFGVGFLVGNKNGLDDIYVDADRRWKGYFEPMTINGYPAVLHSSSDLRDSGTCGLAIGVSDRLAIAVVVTANKDVGRESCAIAQQLASAVVDTVKGA